MARIRGWAGDLHGEEMAARRLVGEAESAGDRQRMAEALGVLGHSLGWQGRFAEAEAVFVRCVGLATAAAHVLWASRSLALLAALDACQGHLVSARKRWTQAVACGPPHDPTVWDCGAFLELLAGDLTLVRAHAAQAKTDDRGARPRRPGWLSALAAMAAVESGRLTEARRILDDTPSAPQSGSHGLATALSWWAEGVATWAEGRPADAAVILHRAARGYSTMGASALVGLVLADLAEVAVAAGDSASATRAATQADDSARRTGAPSHRALARFAVAWALLGQGRHDEAARVAARAVDGLDSSGYVLMAARARVGYACAVRHSDRGAAVAAAREAAAVFGACGAALRRDQACSLLSRLGSDRWCAAAPGTGLAALTSRERQVAELAARGYTARQIAERLSIGSRTVETHLRRIYPKLGVTRKQQLVDHAAEIGLASGP